MPAPIPVPPEKNDEPSSSVNDGTSSQKLMLFMRGNAMSGAPIMMGTNQLPKPPIIAGMTMKNTMIRPCAVISTFQVWSAAFRFDGSLPIIADQVPRYWMPGCASSIRIKPEIAPPMMPAVIAKIR